MNECMFLPDESFSFSTWKIFCVGTTQTFDIIVYLGVGLHMRDFYQCFLRQVSSLCLFIFHQIYKFLDLSPRAFPMFCLFLNPRNAHAFTNASPKCWLLSKSLIAALSRQASMLLTCWRCACVISVISPIWSQAQQAASWSTQSLPKKQSLSLMLQKSKLTLCVSNPQATVWNSSGLESLRNFPQPYNVSQSAMRNRLLWARNRILLPLSTLSPCCWQKNLRKPQSVGLW